MHIYSPQFPVFLEGRKFLNIFSIFHMVGVTTAFVPLQISLSHRSLVVFTSYYPKGRLFYNESATTPSDTEKAKARQKKYENDFRLTQRLRNAYSELMKTLTKMIKDGIPNEEIGRQFGLDETTVKLCLHETGSGKPTVSPLALKILEKSGTAKKLRIPDCGRLYDEIISRDIFKEFPKRVKHTK